MPQSTSVTVQKNVLVVDLGCGIVSMPKHNHKFFKLVYSFAEGEIPEAVYSTVKNITVVRQHWEAYKDPEDVLLAIFLREDGEWKEVWRNEEVETGFQLDVVH